MSEVKDQRDVSEAQIASHWKEEEFLHPPVDFIAQANMADPAVSRAVQREELPGMLPRIRRAARLGSVLAHDARLVESAVLQVVRGRTSSTRRYNCVDRHLKKHRNKAAFIWVAEPESEADRVITYQELWVRVNEFAALLRDFAGLKTGDRVTFHLPMTPDLPVAMLAAARLGVVHSQVFGGFSGAACGDRIADSQCRVLVTMDAYWRNGTADRSQGQGRRSSRGGREAGVQGRQGARLPALPRQVLVAHADGRGARLLRGRRAEEVPRASASRRSRCRPKRRCSSCTPAAPPPSPRAASTAPADTWRT